jgi:hypothetical protein
MAQLTSEELLMLQFEDRRWRRGGPTVGAIRRRLHLSPVEYLERLHAIIDRPEALAVAPQASVGSVRSGMRDSTGPRADPGTTKSPAATLERATTGAQSCRHDDAMGLMRRTTVSFACMATAVSLAGCGSSLSDGDQDFCVAQTLSTEPLGEVRGLAARLGDDDGSNDAAATYDAPDVSARAVAFLAEHDLDDDHLIELVSDAQDALVAFSEDPSSTVAAALASDLGQLQRYCNEG